MKKAGTIIEKFLIIIIYCIIAVAVACFVFAIVSHNTKGEANIGSFDTIDFNTGWVLEFDGRQESVKLPTVVNCEVGDELIIRNTLPDDIVDGMTMCVRASTADMYVYVNGELRQVYDTEGFDHMAYTIPSAYIVTELSSKDAGAPVECRIVEKKKGVLNTIQLANGNNAWFAIIKHNLTINVLAVVVLVLGTLLAMAAVLLNKRLLDRKTTLYLGLIMVVESIWVLSESYLRQLIFNRPALSLIFSYLCLEIVGALIVLYFDEVQHRKYHTQYIIIEFLVVVQVLVNSFLHVTGILEFHRTLRYSHIWIGVGIFISVINILRDWRKGNVKEYSIVGMGMVGFLIMCVAELGSYYLVPIHVLGMHLSVGLLILMTATIVQALVDEVKRADERAKKQTEMLVNTIETIASAIDARDEYTGGHSERVGRYAGIIAREIAEDYGFSNEDIMRIQYIGLMHDIGKIGVPDPILNKAEKLDEEEYELIKKHVDIGYELLRGMDGNIKELLEGIRYHHERYDGKGYPDGLFGEDIPLIARILCLADSYDAMTSNRVYRKRLTDEDVKNEFIKCAGSQFDPELTSVFVRLLERGELKPHTIDGMATNIEGKITLSAVLENRLQRDVRSDKKEVLNPSHVRMLSYMVKLNEKHLQRVDLFLVGMQKKNEMSDGDGDKEALWVQFQKELDQMLWKHDMKIMYTKHSNLIALFGRSDEQIDLFLTAINVIEKEGYCFETRKLEVKEE